MAFFILKIQKIFSTNFGFSGIWVVLITGGGDTIKSQDDVERIFDAYCKRVLKNKLNDYKRSQKIQHSNEVSLYVCENFLKVEDEYFVQKIDFCEEEIFIKNELLKEAMEHLSEDKFEIIICYYFFDMTDTEISKHLNLERKAVNYRRHKALEILNDFISGGFEDGENESEE